MRFQLRLVLVLGCLWAAAALVLVPSAVGSVLHGEVAWWSPTRLPDWFFLRTPRASVAIFAGTAVATALGVLAVVAGRMVLVWRTPPVAEVGTGNWGGPVELEEAKLVGREGVVVGRHRPGEGGLLAYDGPEHHLVVGATRAGKGVGHVIPTLLTWRHSAIVYDPKGELWTTTAGFRSRFGHALRFAPTRPDTCRFNPLLEIRQEAAVRDAQNLANILVDPGGEKDSLSVWDQQSAQFLVAAILHVLYTEPEERKHMGRVRELVMDMEVSNDLMQRTCHVCDADGEPIPHPEIERCARSMAEQGERFRSSVKGTLEGYLILWADPAVVEATATSDFAASDLMCAGHPVTLYLEPPPSDADRLRPLVRAMLYQFSRTLMENLEADNRGRKKNHRLLLLLDEFPTLGKLAFMSDNLRQMSGYGIKAHLIVQSFSDIAAAYGQHNTIIDNCYVVVAFAAADTASAKRISDMVGTVTELRSSFSKRRAAPFAWNSRTESRGEQVRPLLTPAEVRELPEDRQLVLLNGRVPFRTLKVRYFEDPAFKGRVLPPPSVEDGPDAPGWRMPAGEWTGLRALDVLPPGGVDEEEESAERWALLLDEPDPPVADEEPDAGVEEPLVAPPAPVAVAEASRPASAASPVPTVAGARRDTRALDI